MFFFYYGVRNKIVIKYLSKIGTIKFCKDMHHPQILKIIHNSIILNSFQKLCFQDRKKNDYKSEKILFEQSKKHKRSDKLIRPF